MAVVTVAVILELKKIKSVTAPTLSSTIGHKVMEPNAMILVFINDEFQASFFTLLLQPHQEAL